MDKLQQRRTTLLDTYREQRAVVGRVETELREAGLDPEALSARAVLRMGRQQSRKDTWRDEPATDKQRDTLAAMLERRGMPLELLDAPLTKGDADRAIKAALDGQQPALAFPSGEVKRPFVVPARKTSRDPAPEPAPEHEQASELPEAAAVEDPRRVVIATVVERATADAGLNDAASAQANTFDHYIGWAVNESKSQAFSALADLMDEGDPQLRNVARTLLADESLWSEVPRQIAEEVWNNHRGGPSADETAAQDLAEEIVDARQPGPETPTEQAQLAIDVSDALDETDEPERQAIAQEALDLANTAETANWSELGRRAFDPQQLLETADPTAHPQLAAALVGVRSNSKVAHQIRQDFVQGFRAARTEYLEPEAQRAAAEVAADPDVVSLVRESGIGALQLWVDHDFTTLVQRKFEDMPATSDVRAAAVHELRSETRWVRTYEIAQQAVQHAREGIESPFATEAAQEQWRIWAADRLERDPIISTFFSQITGWPRDAALAQATDRLVAEFPKQRPDLAADMRSVDTRWLTADVYQVVHARFAEPQEHPVWHNRRASGWVIDRPGKRGDLEISWRMGTWELTRSGGAKWASYGTDYRAAQGAAEKIAGVESTPEVAAVADAVQSTRDELAERLRGALAGNELIDAIARSDYMRGSEFNAVHNALTREAVDRALADIAADTPALIETAERQGLNPRRLLDEEAVPRIIREGQAAARRAGQNLFTAESAPDLHVPNNHTLIVGDPQGEYVEIRFPVMGGWRLADQEVDLSTAAEAIAEARDRLATTPSPAHPVAVEHQLSEPAPVVDPDVPTAVHADVPAEEPLERDTPAVAAPEQPEAVAGPLRNPDGSITWTTPDGGAVHTDRDERLTWTEGPTAAARESARRLEQRLHAEDEARIDTEEMIENAPDAEYPDWDPYVDGPKPWLTEDATTAGRPDPDQEQLPLTELPKVPQSEMGAPLSTWASKHLIEVERPDGSRVRVTAETLAQYNEPVSVDDADQGIEAPQVEAPTLIAPEAVVAEPRAPSRHVPAVDFELGTEVLVPSSVRGRIEANIDAIRVVKTLDDERRNATPDEQQTLARWSGWGGAWQVFDNQKSEYDAQRAELHDLLSDKEFAAARRSTVNAHYTDPALVDAMWDALRQAGLPDEARVLEPGCGAGHFISHAPSGVRMVGVELDAMTSKIAHYLYPSQHVRNHGFERDFARDASFTAAIGNVPFANVQPYDDKHNPNALSIHNYFIRKSLSLTKPGGYVATITSKFTSDGQRTAAREEIAELGDFVGGIRLPSKAFDRQAKTDVVTDLLIFRRREDGREPTAQTKQWIKSTPMKLDDGRIEINDYFQANPQNVLGTIRIGHGLHGSESLNVDADTSTPLVEQVRDRLSRITTEARATGLGLTAPGVDRTAGLDLDRGGFFTAADTAARVIPGTMRYDEVAARFEQYNAGHWTELPSKGKARTAEWRALLGMGDTVLELVNASRRDGSTFEEREELRAHLNRQYDAYVGAYGPINRYKWTSHASRNTDEQAAKRFPELERKWRADNGDTSIDLDGVTIDEPFDGELPDEIVEELWEAAYTPTQAPYKKRSHLEGPIKYDPRLAMVRGIEHFNDDTHVASKAAVFTDDISTLLAPATSAQSIDEAIAISLDEAGTISPKRMAELLDTTVDDVLDRARGKMYPSLDTNDGWEPAAAFLSGNVRQKLALARQRETENPARYTEAVSALAKTVPVDVDPSKIGLRPGAAWIGVDVYRQFLIQEFNANEKQLKTEYAAITGSWEIRTPQDAMWEDEQHGYRDNWGLPEAGITGIQLFEAMCNNKPIQSRKTAEELEANPKPSFHKGRTEELRDRAERLEERFVQWLWSDTERTDRLTRKFNDTFNSFVQLKHDTEHKKFPGLNTAKYAPFPYQRQAVVRLLHDETVLLDHCVGAGKTLTVAMSCMEMKRLGLVQQPWVVVPNHLVDQWHREVLDAYPGANVLVANDIKDKADRQRFMGQSAAGDWDVVIVPESKFGRMAVSPETQIEYIETEKLALATGLENAKKAGRGHTVKEIEKALERREDQLEKLTKLKGKDTGITFEQTGCDFVFVDEAHMYKNLSRASNSADLAVVKASQRASDMDMKINYLRQQAITRNHEAGRPNAPARAAAFATGTPVSNSMSELWVMQKYLRPDLLDDLEMGHIDAWAQNFARQRTTVEMNVTSTQLRPVSRMAEYTNLPQLVALVDQFRDVVTRDQIPRKLPKLRDGHRTIVEFTLGDNVADFMADLDARMQKTGRDTMHIDNALKISNDGRNASLHPTLANLPAPDPEHDRVQQVVDEVWRVHTENADMHTPADAAGPEADGVFQIIFCDRGTPKAGKSSRDGNLYAMVREQLVQRGMRPEEVAFIHDYPQAKDKQKLFADCRSGKVRVLLGSTEMMSTGVNAQRLLKALHHMDCPYRPADLEQREGRIIRQGNVNEEVEILTYVAERSFDATMWQIVERKAHYIEQLKTGDVPQSMEDIGGEMAMSAAQTKAAATGDPIYVRAVELEADVKKLVNEEKSINQINRLNEYMARKFERDIPIQQQQVEELRTIAAPINKWFDTDREQRKITIGSATVIDGDSEKVIGALQTTLNDRYTYMQMNKSEATETLFEVAGVPVYGTYHVPTGALRLHTDGGLTRYLERNEVLEAMASNKVGHGLMARVRNMLKEVNNWQGRAERDLTEMTSRLAALREEPPLEFTKGPELRQLEHDLGEMKADINARENSPEALRRFAEESDRRGRMGQYGGWTLDLNPTVGHADDRGMTRDDLKDSVPERMQAHAERWTEEQAARAEARQADPWLPRSSDGSVYQLGGDRESGLPGARVQWTDRMWHWTAWDGQGNIETALSEQRNTAQSTAQYKAVAFAKEREISSDYLLHRKPLPEIDESRHEEAPTAPDEQQQVAAEPPNPEDRGERNPDVDRPAWEAAQGPLTPPNDVRPHVGEGTQHELPQPPIQRDRSHDQRRDGGRSL
ncbi:DEAD/DEAH box helicase family protein [Rhodococcus hoagii]|nr:DEAD/DEAH box helicase family protein [Prescottella equi]